MASPRLVVGRTEFATLMRRPDFSANLITVSNRFSASVTLSFGRQMSRSVIRALSRGGCTENSTHEDSTDSRKQETQHEKVHHRKREKLISPSPRGGRRISSSAFLSRRPFGYYLPIASYGTIFAAKWSSNGGLEAVVSK